MARTEHTAASIAELVGGELVGSPDVPIRGVGALDDAPADHVTFITAQKYQERWAHSRAGAAVVTKGLEPPGHDPKHRALIFVDDAEVSIIRLLELFAPPPALPGAGVHSTAWVHPEATLGERVRVGHQVTIDRGSVVGDDVTLCAGVRVGAEVRIGDGSLLHANSVVRERCRLGRRVILQPGAVIGAEGFGYRPDPSGSKLLRVPHSGTGELHDDVEIGANACVDRGKFGPTVVGEGTKIDNMVQIGHNCRIGRHCVIAAFAGLSGSVEIGDWVQIGGGAGFTEHVKIGDGARILARSGLMRDVPPGKAVFGYVADDSKAALRQLAALRKLPDLIGRLSLS
jgi:UDP-3-O-[3-hydroxymyristoyl] glucosamine N-acyltransferase